MKKTIMISIVVTMLLAGVVLAEDDVTVSVNNTFATAFVSGTGINWVNGPVLMTDVGTTVTRGDHAFSGIYWQVLNLDDTIGYDNPMDSKGQVTERDFIFDYTYSGCDFANVSLGYIYYDFTQLTKAMGNNTEDLYTTIALKDVPLNPSASVFYDRDGANEGIYGNFAISHSVDLTEENTIDLWAKAVWTGDNYGAAYFSSDGLDDSGFQSYGIGASTALPLSDTCSATLGVTYWTLADSDGVVGKPHTGAGSWAATSPATESERDTVVFSAALNIMVN